MSGERIASSKMRIGFFAQHQSEELIPTETPIDHIRRHRPDETPQKLRARLADGGVGAEIAETPCAKLSGGQKARLCMCLATLEAPHLFILDEPTNHLDIESREALVMALNDYTGAVILITHDTHLVDLVADRLWLVKGGRVRPWDEDMAAYRRFILSGDAPVREKPKPAAPKPKRPDKGTLTRLRSEARKAEERVEKLNEMLEKIDARLGEPDFYDRPAKEIRAFEAKRHEILDGIARAEAIWLDAAAALEEAEALAG